ncbi:hypothetical protein Y032_0732g1908, partial [Ancylostoma ceylanicum]
RLFLTKEREKDHRTKKKEISEPTVILWHKVL